MLFKNLKKEREKGETEYTVLYIHGDHDYDT